MFIDNPTDIKSSVELDPAITEALNELDNLENNPVKEPSVSNVESNIAIENSKDQQIARENSSVPAGFGLGYGEGDLRPDKVSEIKKSFWKKLFFRN